MKEKNSSKKIKGGKSLKSIFRMDVLKDKNFLLWCLASIIGLSGYFIPYFFVPGLNYMNFTHLYDLLISYFAAYATNIGLTAAQGSTLIAVMSAANFIGRIMVGYVVRKQRKKYPYKMVLILFF